MTESSAFDRALDRVGTSDRQRPRDMRPLARMASCADLPERETVVQAAAGEMQPGFLLDGRFLVREVVGRSGMATIYLATDQDLGGDVAVKVPLMKIESDPVSFGRFEREGRIGVALSDPLLLGFKAPDPRRSRPYIVTEFLDGCTLAWVMRRTRPLAEDDALGIASALCDALRHMHGRGFIHRDLKPDNVMVCRDGRLCLMDFGLAAEIDEGRGFLAGLAPLFGTPEYMAPEQVANKRNDERTDVYCVGVILYEMLTGQLPFVAEDPWEAAHMRVSGDPVSLRSINPAISEETEEIVLHAMRRDPSERFPSVAALKAELDEPHRVHVTGLSQRLRAPRFRLSLQGTPILSGIIIGVGALALMVGIFVLLIRHK
ncbi:MAG TPA: serine/threonine-protein kinase [Opitutaceae bacterium]